MAHTLERTLRHLLSSRSQVRRAFPPASLDAIESAVQASEAGHSGEVRFVVEGALDGAPLWSGSSARERALTLFSELRVWDTEQNNGLLIYLLLADRAVEIVADRGLHGRVGEPEWRLICARMETAFRAGQFEAGVLAGIEAVSRHLQRHFPPLSGDLNELPDRPLML